MIDSTAAHSPVRAHFYAGPGLGITEPDASFGGDDPVASLLSAIDSYKGPVVILRFARDAEWIDAILALNRRVQEAQRALMTGGAVIVGGTASRDVWVILAQWPDGDGWRVQIERQTLTAQIAPRPAALHGLTAKMNGRG